MLKKILAKRNSKLIGSGRLLISAHSSEAILSKNLSWSQVGLWQAVQKKRMLKYDLSLFLVFNYSSWVQPLLFDQPVPELSFRALGQQFNSRIHLFRPSNFEVGSATSIGNVHKLKQRGSNGGASISNFWVCIPILLYGVFKYIYILHDNH